MVKKIVRCIVLLIQHNIVSHVMYKAYWLENRDFMILKVIYHLLYSMNNFVTNKSKLPQDGAQVFPYMG